MCITSGRRTTKWRPKAGLVFGELRWLDAAVLTGDPKPREGLDMSWTLLKVLL